MRTSHIRIHFNGPRAALSGRQPGLLRKIVAATLGVVALVAAFMLSVVVLAVVATAGVIGGAWLWWRTRELRKRIAEQVRAREQAAGRVIDGEVIRDPN